MEFSEFSDVSLDNTDSSLYHSFDNFSSDVEFHSQSQQQDVLEFENQTLSDNSAKFYKDLKSTALSKRSEVRDPVLSIREGDSGLGVTQSVNFATNDAASSIPSSIVGAKNDGNHFTQDLTPLTCSKYNIQTNAQDIHNANLVSNTMLSSSDNVMHRNDIDKNYVSNSNNLRPTDVSTGESLQLQPHLSAAQNDMGMNPTVIESSSVDHVSTNFTLYVDGDGSLSKMNQRSVTDVSSYYRSLSDNSDSASHSSSQSFPPQPFPGDDFYEQTLSNRRRFCSEGSITSSSVTCSGSQDDFSENTAHEASDNRPQLLSKQVSRSSFDELLFELYDKHSGE